MADSGNQNWAVDQLLQAEEEANAIIKQAQKDREGKMKEARMAAEQEIAQIRKEQEQKYQNEIKNRFGSTQEDEELEKITKEDIDRIYQDYEKNKNEVIDMLIERIINVEIEIPLALKGDFGSKQ